MSRLVHPVHVWPRVLRVGLLLWTASVLVTELTGNPTLVPTVILLGSFLVPVTCTVMAWEHRYALDKTSVSTAMVVRAATMGGLLGVLMAAVVEHLVVHPDLAMFYEVGLIEEAAKLGALLWCTRVLAVRSLRDGLVLGATVGFGFAGLESAGYAFNAFFTPHGLSFTSLVNTEVLRALLAPFGHGVWTAVAAGAWFAAFPSGCTAARHARRQRRSAVPDSSLPTLTAAIPAITGRRSARLMAFATLLFVAILHAAFDGMHGLVLTVLNLANALRTGSVSKPWSGDTVSYQVAYDTGLCLVIVLGLCALVVMCRAARTREAAASAPAPIESQSVRLPRER